MYKKIFVARILKEMDLVRKNVLSQFIIAVIILGLNLFPCRYYMGTDISAFSHVNFSDIVI